MRQLSALALIAALVTIFGTGTAAQGMTAATQQRVRLTVSITGSGSVRLSDGHRLACSRKCRKTFSVRAGAKLGLTARPGSGWVLSTWSGACLGAKPTCGLRLRHATGVAVTFGPPGSTNANPIPLGQDGQLGNGWELKVLSATPNATQQIVAIPGNSPPPPGAQYFMLDVAATYMGGGSGDLSLFTSVLTTRAHNVEYRLGSSDCQLQHLPPPVFPVSGSLSSGQTATGNICFQIPSNDADSLVLCYDEDPNTIWFALK